MVKDRARPFSKKHRKYWVPVTGGMILIGVINVALGFCTYDPPAAESDHTRIELVIPKAQYREKLIVIPGRPEPPADAPDADAAMPAR